MFESKSKTTPRNQSEAFWPTENFESIYRREMKEARLYRFGVQIFLFSIGFAFFYTVTLMLVGSDGAAGWVDETKPIVSFATRLLPKLSRLTADLVHRGYASRVAFVTNVIAGQWLIIGVGWLIAALAVLADARQVGHATVIARTNGRSFEWRYGALGAWMVRVLLGLYAVYMLFDGSSHLSGRPSRSYDLGKDSFGLLLFFLGAIYWWGWVYIVYIRVVGLLAPALYGSETRLR